MTTKSVSDLPGIVGCQMISSLMVENGPISPEEIGPTFMPSREYSSSMRCGAGNGDSDI